MAVPLLGATTLTPVKVVLVIPVYATVRVSSTVSFPAVGKPSVAFDATVMVVLLKELALTILFE
tara:strand:- start:24 stop:215 length:192 start_codon:yes stop_codon:yes gene_type:complete